MSNENIHLTSNLNRHGYQCHSSCLSSGVVVRSRRVIVLNVSFCDNLLTIYSGLPFPTWFTRLVVVDSVPLPLNAIIASMLFVLILALLVLGGDQAFNSIVGLLNGAVGLTYVLSIGCVLWRRTFGEPLPPARWSLGKLGIPLNIIAVLYQSFATIISFFPLFAEVTAANFNWYVQFQIRIEAYLTNFTTGQSPCLRWRSSSLSRITTSLGGRSTRDLSSPSSKMHEDKYRRILRALSDEGK
jgi:CBS domain containing-hemolysin-like protein